MIKQFVEDVCWGELDYLIIDTPPGTSDEHISAIQNLKQHSPDGAVLVTTPQVLILVIYAIYIVNKGCKIPFFFYQ